MADAIKIAPWIASAVLELEDRGAIAGFSPSAVAEIIARRAPAAPDEAALSALETARHTHGNAGDGTDACIFCGLDLRNTIHLRTGQEPGHMGKLLPNYHVLRAAQREE